MSIGLETDEILYMLKEDGDIHPTELTEKIARVITENNKKIKEYIDSSGTAKFG